jgi:hypothetical protein
MREAVAVRRISRELWIGLASIVLAVAAMAVDHLLGEDDSDSGLVDPPAFAITVALSVVAATFLFGRVVPRAQAGGSERAARIGLVCSSLSVVPGFAFFWAGVTFVVAGAGIALGLSGLGGRRRREAIAAIALGLLSSVFGAGFYVVGAVDRLR